MAANDCLNFTVQVYNSIGEASYSKSLDIATHENPYILKGLKPYTDYKLYVTLTNNAKTNPESSPSNMIIVRTLEASPQTPDKPLPSDVASSTSTVVFVPPTVNDENGPIEYVLTFYCFVNVLIKRDNILDMLILLFMRVPLDLMLLQYLMYHVLLDLMSKRAQTTHGM